MNELLHIAKELAFTLAEESNELYKNHQIIDDDFSKLLTAIQNLTEYLNRVYFKDNIIEEEVISMTKTLYDPVVEERGIQKGIDFEKIEVAKNLLDILDDEIISTKVGLDIEKVRKLRREKYYS